MEARKMNNPMFENMWTAVVVGSFIVLLYWNTRIRLLFEKDEKPSNPWIGGKYPLVVAYLIACVAIAGIIMTIVRPIATAAPPSESIRP